MNNKQNQKITSRKINFAKWYTDVIKQSELCDYGSDNGSTSGTIIFRPRGYAIWENIQNLLNKKFKILNIENVMLPLLINKKIFEIEKKNILNFSSEFLTINKFKKNELIEELIIRPTSEVLFCSHFSKIINSYKQLPLLYNQWCNVFRIEKNTKPFLRNSEFLWQEGHTIHNNEIEAKKFTLKMINLYADFIESQLSIKVIVGMKTIHERFAGAKTTYTIETMMQDGQALQTATSHYFGQKLTKLFNIKFSNKQNKQEYPYQTSWGVSTRLIGALIMAHSDDMGLVLPSTISPYHIIILNLSPKNKKITNIIEKLFKFLNPHFKVLVNNDNKSNSYKKIDSQIKGIPLTILIGEQEFKNKIIKLILRHNLNSINVKFNNKKTLLIIINNQLKILNQELFENSRKKIKTSLKELTDFNEYQKLVKIHKGFFIVPFCDQIKCEQEIKSLTGTTSRCIPFELYKKPSNCFKCQNPNSVWTYFARSY